MRSFSIFQEVVLSREKDGTPACHGLCGAGSGEEEGVAHGEEAESLPGQYHTTGEEKNLSGLQNLDLTYMKAKPGQGKSNNPCLCSMTYKKENTSYFFGHYHYRRV